MKNYDFPVTFRSLYDKAVDLYAKGQRGSASYFKPDESAWLASNGLTAQHVYDYAEDHNGGGEPGFEHALTIEFVRRGYFLGVQAGKQSSVVLDETSLPSKSDSINGIEWLPRLIPKAKAKLRGELPESLMFCCGGDRRFFKAHDILPAGFLALVWNNEQDDKAIVDWVVKHSALRR